MALGVGGWKVFTRWGDERRASKTIDTAEIAQQPRPGLEVPILGIPIEEPRPPEQPHLRPRFETAILALGAASS